jgi:hypothetical protein
MTLSTTPSAPPPPHILWSSTGDGWRAMFADIGYANIFQQAGVVHEQFISFLGCGKLEINIYLQLLFSLAGFGKNEYIMFIKS